MSATETDIILDPSSVGGSNETYTSLTDLNKIPLFTSEFQNSLNEISKEKEMKSLYLHNNDVGV